MRGGSPPANDAHARIMRGMRTRRVVLLIGMAVACAARAQAPVAPAPAAFGWFGELAGTCWTGTFPDGKTVHRHCYTRQFDRFMRGTAVLSATRDGELRPMFSGDSVYAWDAAGPRIVYYLWGSDGQHRQLEARYEGDELTFPVPARDDPSKVAFRSVWKRIDADTLEVRRERPAAEKGWREELKVTYRRSPGPPEGGR